MKAILLTVTFGTGQTQCFNIDSFTADHRDRFIYVTLDDGYTFACQRLIVQTNINRE